MASGRIKDGRRLSRDSDENSSELHGNKYPNSKTEENGDRLQREHFLKPDSDQIDLNLLLDAVLDINDKLRTQEQGTTSCATKYTEDCDSTCTSKSSKKPLKSTQEIPKKPETRQNFSFRNEQVLAIDIENQRLLREISRPRPRSAASTRDKTSRNTLHEPFRIKTSSEVNRKKFQRRIDEENQALLRRLEAAKPTKGLNREYLLQRQGGRNKKNRSRPSSACSSGRLSNRTLVSEHNGRDNDSVHTEKSSRKKFLKPAWEAGW